MIKRYTRPAMGRIWTEESKYRCWLQVELAATEVLAEDGVVPATAAAAIAKGRASAERILEIEAEVKHDVIAFSRTAVSESLKSQGLGEESRWLHFGPHVQRRCRQPRKRSASERSLGGSSEADWRRCSPFSNAAPSSSSTLPPSAARTAFTPSPPPSASSCSTGMRR